MYSDARSAGAPICSLLKAGFRHNVTSCSVVYPESKAVLLISPKQPYYTDQEKFSAIIELINRSNFKELLIVIGDTNNHLNYLSDGLSKETALEIARQEGDSWLEKNCEYIFRLKIKYDIVRWQTWLESSTYQSARRELELIYQSNRSFRTAFHHSAKEFLKRCNINSLSSHWENTLEYLKEECALIMPAWASIGINFIIYPSEMLAAMKITFETMVQPYYPPHTTHWLSLRFKRLSQPEQPLEGSQVVTADDITIHVA